MGLIRAEDVEVFVVASMVLAMLNAQMHVTEAKSYNLSWTVETTTVTRNCESVDITTVNGQYPGPTVEINEGDTVVINVTNAANYNVTIHWHGIFQFLSNWADGPARITQCPLQIGSSQTYEFTVTGQSGTFFWHAHNNWLRATVFGAFIVHPVDTPSYGKVAGEFSILSGEWYSEDPNFIEKTLIDTSQPPTDNTTVANTINGQPGPLYGCPGDTQKFQVKKGSTYLLRLTNAGLNNDHYFTVANHTLTVVAADANYVKPFETDYVVTAPGQTTDVLFTANQPIGSYYCGIGVTAQPVIQGAAAPSEAALAIIEYEGSTSDLPMSTPEFPTTSDMAPTNAYLPKLKGLAPYDLPATMDHELVYVIGIARVACTTEEPCAEKVAGTVQNITFDEPQSTSLLQAYYNNVTGVYTNDLPDNPPAFEDFTSAQDINYLQGSRGTRVRELQFNDTVQLVLQNVWALQVPIDHPFHLHGHDFYVVGQNSSNFNPDVDPLSFNLVDPPKFNTFTLPYGGWVALRFRANNPGVWLFHCHFERHKTWGMETVFITRNGAGAQATLPGPRQPLPSCT